MLLSLWVLTAITGSDNVHSMVRNKATLGDRMREIRLAHGLTLEQIGQIMRMGRAGVHKLENNGSADPKLEGFLRFCAHFNVDPYYMVFGKPKAALRSDLQ